MIDFRNIDCMVGMLEYPDKYFDLAIVDPVYGDVSKGGYMYGKGGEKLARRIDYNYALWDQPKTGEDYFEELKRVCKNMVVWGGNYFANWLPPSQGWIVWDKRHPEGIRFADAELAYTSFNVATRIFRFLWNGMLQEDMKNKQRRIHPTQKPVPLYEWILENYAQPGDKILDTHVGSGSSLIACYNLGFDATGFEIDEEYFRKAQDRLNDEMAQIRMF